MLYEITRNYGKIINALIEIWLLLLESHISLYIILYNVHCDKNGKEKRRIWENYQSLA